MYQDFKCDHTITTIKRSQKAEYEGIKSTGFSQWVSLHYVTMHLFLNV